MGHPPRPARDAQGRGGAAEPGGQSGLGAAGSQGSAARRRRRHHADVAGPSQGLREVGDRAVFDSDGRRILLPVLVWWLHGIRRGRLTPLPRREVFTKSGHFCSADVTGSKPLFLIAAVAAGDARQLMSALAASGSFALAATPAENTVIFWSSAGNGPT